LALVVLSVLEQRLDAVRLVLAGADVTEVAAQLGMHRSTVHRWMARYLTDQVAGLADRSHRPMSCPHQASADLEVLVAEMRRKHPRWGSRRIRLELLRAPVAEVVPAERTIDRILVRQGLLRTRPRKRPRESFVRFERPGPMQLWGIDIVGGVQLVDIRTGEIRDAKLVTGVDDHSRFCVMAAVVERATSRAVCLAFAQALARFGAPEEVITDNGKQFTDRFGKGGEVLFDKICRRNGINHLLTAPSSPNQNGKVERFHGTFRPDFLADAGPFDSVAAAQAAIDAWVEQYNTDRPHQGLDQREPVTPADRFRPAPQAERALVDLWLPAALEPSPHRVAEDVCETHRPAPFAQHGGAVELDRAVPVSGNMSLCGQQFWLGRARAGQLVRFWVDCDLVHLSVGGTRIKTVRSHLTVADLTRLLAEGARPAGPPPLPTTPGSDGVIEVERVVSRGGTITLGGQVILAAEILGGRQVGVRIEEATLLFFDLQTRELLRTRPNPIPPGKARFLRGVRPTGPPPRPSVEPITVQRRASNSGVIMVCGQKVALGRIHHHQTLTIRVSETTLAIELDDGETRVVRRTTTQAVRNIKADRPRTVPSVS
jgi:transposase InsO family protein